MDVADPFDLHRFVRAQAGSFDAAREELRQGRKRSHWMWFVFPQVAGLGHSAMAQRYAIASLDEARAFLAHPLLSPRLRELTQILLDLPQSDPRTIFGEVDAIKLRSCLTLFDRARPGEIFERALVKFFGGEADPATLNRLT
jgi:uncharacterized protein (DUF1810 family)